MPDSVDEQTALRNALVRSTRDTEDAHRYRQFVGATFTSISLGDYEFSPNDGHQLVFLGSNVKVGVNLRNSVFDEGIKFWFTNIEGYAHFRDATIEGNVEFVNTTVNGEVSFLNASVEDEVRFEHVTIHGVIHADGATLNGGARFIDSTTDENIYLRDGIVDGEVDFTDATISGETDLRGITITGEATFKNTVFEQRALFSSSESKITRFGSTATFTEATFTKGIDVSGEVIKDDVFQTTFSEPPDFVNADLERSDFSQASLPGANFKGADLTESNFTEAILQNTILERAKLSRAELSSTDLRGARLAGASLGDTNINQQTKFLGSPEKSSPSSNWAALREYLNQPSCVYDPTYQERNNEEQLLGSEEKPGNSLPDASRDRAKSVYQALEKLATVNARPQLQAAAFVRRQDVQRNQYYHRFTNSIDETPLFNQWSNFGRYLRATVARWTLLYGESPWRILAWSIGIVLFFTVLYPFGLMETADGTVLTWDSIDSSPSQLIQSLYFSTLTFTALGFGDFRPTNAWGQAATIIETASGAILLALLVFVLGRRAAR